jgi:hypothetical protein
MLQAGGGFAIYDDDGQLTGKGIDQQLKGAGLAAAGRTAQQRVVAQVVDFHTDGKDGVGVANRPATATMGNSCPRTQASQPAGAAAFLRLERMLALRAAPE